MCLVLKWFYCNMKVCMVLKWSYCKQAPTCSLRSDFFGPSSGLKRYTKYKAGNGRGCDDVYYQVSKTRGLKQNKKISVEKQFLYIIKSYIIYVSNLFNFHAWCFVQIGSFSVAMFSLFSLFYPDAFISTLHLLTLSHDSHSS